MSRLSARRIGVAMWVLSGSGMVMSLAFGWANSDVSPAQLPAGLVFLVVIQGMASLGVMIAARDPRNLIGWIYSATALLLALSGVGAYGKYALITNPGTLPGGLAAVWFSNVAWFAALGLYASFLLLLFPDGRLPGRRWRPVAWLGIASVTSVTIGFALQAGPMDKPFEQYANPVGIDGAQYLLAGVIGIPIVALAGVAGAIVRYRRGNSVERQQLKWFVAAVSCFVAFFIVDSALESVASIQAPDIIFALSLGVVPLSAGIAILRYRLYDIDVIIRKTLVYVGVVVPLVAMYLSGVVVLGAVSRSATGQSGALAVTLSTLAVAAVFQPLRRRVQTAVDRRFYRSKYDTARTLEGFSGRLRQQIDLEALQVEVLGVVQETLAPASATLWLRAAGGGR